MRAERFVSRSRSRGSSRSSLLALLALLVAMASGAPGAAAAQEGQGAAILETQAAAGVDEAIAQSAGRMIRVRLDGLEVVQTSSGVALDLGEVQLALGCTGESVECLGPVADELSTRFLVIPHLAMAEADLMLTITLFDRQDNTISRASRQATGQSALLEMIDGQLRELFDLPPAQVSEDPDPTPTPAPAPAGPELTPTSFILLGLGAVALGVGAGLGVAFLDEEAAYTAARPMNEEEVDAALASYSSAEGLAIGADVLFVIGGLGLAVGLTVLVLELTAGPAEGDARGVRLVPVASSNYAGFAMDGSF